MKPLQKQPIKDALDLFIYVVVQENCQTTPQSPYSIMEEINSRLKLINSEVSPGVFYYRIKNLIKNNLLNTTINHEKLNNQEFLEPTLERLIDINQILKSFLTIPTLWEHSVLFICLNIIEIKKEKELLKSIINLLKIRMIEINHINTGDNKNERQQSSQQNLLLKIHQINYLEYAIKWATSIYKQLTAT